MLEATDEIKDTLRELAEERSRPFCYSDYMTVSVDGDGEYRCPKCGSDDLMREVEGVGVEWGLDWVIDHLVETDGEKIDIEELFRDVLDEIYEPIKFGELEYCPSQVLEAVDSTAFRMGCNENADRLVEDGQIVCLNGSYYRIDALI